jgi:CBS domain-containing protein
METNRHRVISAQESSMRPSRRPKAYDGLTTETPSLEFTEHNSFTEHPEGRHAMTKAIRDVLTHKSKTVLSIQAEETVYKALELMAAENVGALLVMKNGKVVGIMSERDYARKVILEGRSSLKTAVEKIMTTKVLYINPDMSVDEALALMSDKRCRHLPVFENEQLVGMVSIGDLVKAQIAEKDFMISQLEHYILGS